MKINAPYVYVINKLKHSWYKIIVKMTDRKGGRVLFAGGGRLRPLSGASGEGWAVVAVSSTLAALLIGRVAMLGRAVAVRARSSGSGAAAHAPG